MGKRHYAGRRCDFAKYIHERKMLTKVFQSGNSQAVRIPLGFRFQTDTVEIIKAENGDIILRPVRNKDRQFLALFDDFDDDFVAAFEDRDTAPPQERDTL